jgi:L-cysteine:1D-myo-inositol 2-amino-2-deoxy-alpha-D-glucopyranoside ligase
MKHSYDQDVMWHHSMIESAAAEIEELRECLSRVDVAPTESVISALISSLSNNLDTAHVVKELKLWIQETKSGKTGGHAGELSRAIDSLLGLAL